MAYLGLSRVNFGHIAAEEEAAALQRYFIETKEYSDVLSDKKKILVVGRKGSGKSAIYVAIRDMQFALQGDFMQDANTEVEQPIDLYELLVERFDEQELRTLAFNLNVDYDDDLLVVGKANKARELIRYLQRRDQVSELVAMIRRQRPDVRWDRIRLESPRESAYMRPTIENVKELRHILADRFSLDEIRILCTDLGVDYENLAGSTKEEKALELINYLRRRDQLSNLVDAIREIDPDASWGNLPGTSKSVTFTPHEPAPNYPSADFLSRLAKNMVVEALTLRDYPWELHKQVKDAGVPPTQSYENSWRYVIWVLLTKRMLGFGEPARYKLADALVWKSIFNANIRYLSRFLKKNYGRAAPTLGEIFVDRASQIRTLKIKDFEIGADGSSNSSQRLSQSINFVNREIQSHLLTVLPKEKQYYLLFDQLDLGWDGTEESKQLLIGLILAARSVTQAAEEAGKQVRVVLFLRSDIFEVLKFEDKNKIWHDNVVELTWDEARLKRLVSKRIEVSANGRWEDVFAEPRQQRPVSQLRYIVQRTMLRPRDMIQFCAYAKDVALRLDRDIVDMGINHAACNPYSEYMVREIQDECRTSVPHIDEMLSLLKEIGLERLTTKQFAGACQMKGIDEKRALRQLIDLSVLGVCREVAPGKLTKIVFRYEAQPWDHLDPTPELAVHPSLKPALGIV